MPDRLDSSRQFWDAEAQRNARMAVLGDAAMEDPTRAAAAFDAVGEHDAHLAWFVTKDSRVLDLGCGLGRMIKRLAPHCAHITGVDISAEMLSRARTYLEGVPNYDLVHTNGASLGDLDDGGLDFVFSLLCLIHVDRRSAYKYMLELARVLKPSGLGFLQFLNILSPRGFAYFSSTVDRSDPLEFYTPEEVQHKLQEAGLSVLGWLNDAEFINVVVVKGSPEAWRDRVRSAVTFKGAEGTGLFGTDSGTLEMDGEATLHLVHRGDRALTLHVTLTLAPPEPTSAEDCYFRAHGLVQLEPGRETRATYRYEAATRTLTLTADGQPAVAMRSSMGSRRGSGPAQLILSLMPPGHQHTPESERLFPGWVRSVSLTLEDVPRDA